MKPMPQYDSVYHYPILKGPQMAMSNMATDIMPLVHCLDGIVVFYPIDDDVPSWSHYQDVPPSQAMERIEKLAQIIATHYPDTTS